MYDSFLGEDATPEQRREMQAYWLSCETEWIRAERTMAGVLSFCHLTNNYGYTGDWYINHIKDLEPGISLKWFKHAFAPANVFIDLADQRYFPNGFYQPGEKLVFNLVGINDLNIKSAGTVTVKLLDADGKVISENSQKAEIKPFGRENIPYSISLPKKEGGYLILSEFKNENSSEILKSRRYIRIGNNKNIAFIKVSP
jgi:beta-galactosidase